jgi:hypothetical protein
MRIQTGVQSSKARGAGPSRLALFREVEPAQTATEASVTELKQKLKRPA